MTLLIKNVRVLGGIKDFGESTDVFVVGNKISAIGSLTQKPADIILDGQGAYLSPGFIDIGSTADHYLDIFENPKQENLLSQGITTIVGGQCGFSLAPLLYGNLDMIRKWTDTNKVNVNWHNLKEFFTNLKKRKLGVNFATLTGHLTIRQELLGESIRDLTANELAVIKKVVKDSLENGSAGVSFGLEYAHGKATPIKEIKALAELVKAEDGVCSVHLRSRDENVLNAYEEALVLATGGNKTLISHFSPLQSAAAEYEKILAELYDLPAAVPLYISVRPLEENIVPLYFVLPEWARKGGLDEMFRQVKDDWLYSKIAKELLDIDPAKIVIIHAVKNEALENRNFKELMDVYGFKTFAETFRKVVLSTGLRATISLGELDEKLVVAAWKHPRSLLGTFTPRSINSKSTLLHFLDRVEKESLMSLEEAVWKLSGFPAKLFGFNGRGKVAEGNIADLVAFKNGEVKFTIIGGNLAYKPGENTGLFGEPLKHTKNGF